MPALAPLPGLSARELSPLHKDYANMTANAQILSSRFAHYRVRTLARTPSPGASALFDAAAERLNKYEWTPGEWQALLATLDACELTVGEWLSQPFDAGPCLS